MSHYIFYEIRNASSSFTIFFQVYRNGHETCRKPQKLCLPSPSFCNFFGVSSSVCHCAHITWHLHTKPWRQKLWREGKNLWLDAALKLTNSWFLVCLITKLSMAVHKYFKVTVYVETIRLFVIGIKSNSMWINGNLYLHNLCSLLLGICAACTVES